MRKLVSFTFDHFRRNPWFIRLLSTENILRAEFVKRMAEIPELHSPIVEQIRTVLRAGQDAGLFRPGVDPVHLYISIAGLSYFYFANIHTLSVIFSIELASESEIAARREHVQDVIVGICEHEALRALRRAWWPGMAVGFASAQLSFRGGRAVPTDRPSIRRALTPRPGSDTLSANGSAPGVQAGQTPTGPS
jgi:hypothetical protein